MATPTFFSELRAFSELVYSRLGITERSSPWVGGYFARGAPTGVVLHYTATNDFRSTVSWFLCEKYQARVSAHLLIADGWPKGTLEWARPYPQIVALPSLVLQCVSLSRRAWHATWFNSQSIGIELVNSGELRMGPGSSWLDCRDNWGRRWVSEKAPVHISGRYWEPYGPDQVLAAIAVLREIRRAYPGQIRPECIVGHEQVQGVRTIAGQPNDKRDPGPAFPLEGVREAALEEVDPEAYLWFDRFSKDGSYGQSWQDAQVVRWWGARRGNGHAFHATPSRDVAWADYLRELLGSFLRESGGFGSAGKVALALLGYAVSDIRYPDLRGPDENSLALFVRMMGLPKGVGTGLELRRALVDRLEDRGVIGRLAG